MVCCVLSEHRSTGHLVTQKAAEKVCPFLGTQQVLRGRSCRGLQNPVWDPRGSVGSELFLRHHGGCWLLWASPGRSSPRSVIIVLVRALWWEDAETISTELPLLGSSLEYPFYTNCDHRRHTIVQTPCFTGGLHSQCCAFYSFGQYILIH